MRVYCFALLAALANVATADVLSLTPDNYFSATDKKTVFLKFFAPWCGHCKKMAPDWEKLAGEWADHEVGLVAEVDCTAEGKPLCDQNGVKGFPTLKYGDPSALEDYSGSRSYDALATFAKENLKPVCSPANIDLCDADKKKQLEGYLKMDLPDIEALIKKEEDKLAAADKEFQDAVAELQATYQKLNEEKEAKVAAVQSSGLGLLKSVRASRTSKDDDAKEEL